MMNGKFCLIAVCVLALFFYNCNRKLDSTTSTNVYALIKGIDRNIKYYKNGVLHILEDTDAGSASDIYVDGMDVYVAGTVYGVLKCWKNDVEVFVDNSINRIGSTGLCISGGSFFISGYREPNALDHLKTPLYWSNNIRVPLTTDSVTRASTSGIAVYNGDVYVSGYEQVYLENPGTHIPKYWKNGKEVILPGNPAYTTDIKVQNGTVYISGAINFMPVYWRNGIVQELELPNGDFFYQTSGISVNGGNVYVSGTIGEYVGETRVIKPVYWKNGKLVRLNVTDAEYFTHGILVHGSDVYTYGFSFRVDKYGNFIHKPKYWKNSAEIALPGDGECVSLFIK
ncbi:hypothetical protein ACLOAU_16695 [Niabella sp. CJ426]|uniref:hypothetical protein n=1 Tax=Niabella sp. CJ426 TaxID=3393740 RepID=UPI003D08B089